MEKDTLWDQLIGSLVDQGILKTKAVIKGMRLVPRKKFVPSEAEKYQASDVPLQIGFGQAISAPRSLNFG